MDERTLIQLWVDTHPGPFDVELDLDSFVCDCGQVTCNHDLEVTA